MIKTILILALSFGMSEVSSNGAGRLVKDVLQNEHTAVSVAPYLSDFQTADVVVPSLIQVGRQATGKVGLTAKPHRPELAGMLVDANNALIRQGGAPFKLEWG